MLSISDSWQSGDPYERYVGRWSRQIAPRFLAWLALAPGRRWLDVGCGTGALCAAIVEHAAPSAVCGVDPSEGFLKTAARALPAKVTLRRGSAGALPLEGASVDAVVSGLVLNFVPDAAAAVTEMARVCVPAGCIAAYVWDYAGKMELMRYFWDAATAVDPRAAALDEGPRFPLCNPDRLRDCFAACGLRQVELTAIEVPTRFESFDDYWRPFLGGQGPAPAYAMSLDEPTRTRLRERLRESLPASRDGSISLTARAWAVRATTT